MIRNFLVLSILFGLIACMPSQKERKNIAELEKTFPPQEAFNVVYYYSDSGRVVARLKAPYVLERIENEKTYSEFTKGFRLDFLDGNKNVRSTMSAESGSMDMEKGLAEANGNVEVLNENKERLETEHLMWNKTKDIIYTNRFVKIHTEDEIIYGDSLLANTEFTDYTIFQIRGIINLKE